VVFFGEKRASWTLERFSFSSYSAGFMLCAVLREGDVIMAAYVTSGRAIVLAAVALFSITACGKLGLGGSSDEVSWARAALERNDRIEIVAVDPATSTFTVRIKETGDLRMVRADQVVAGPPGAPVSSAGTPAGPAATQAGGATQSAMTDSSQASAPASASGADSMASAGQQAMSARQPAAATAQDTTQGAASESNAPPAGSQSMMRQSNARASAPHTGFQSEPAPAAEVPNPNSDVTSITPGGRVLESGPGYAIKAASKTAPATARVERERSSTTSSAVERRHDPIVCQGDRFLQIDNRNLEFDGDAVTAEDGCEIHITNSHISAKGVGVFARSANVHIDNSQIEGDSASIDASDGAQVYVSSSRFKGISRRVDSSAFHDLGGNVWN
jgi:hypothetical protein